MANNKGAVTIPCRKPMFEHLRILRAWHTINVNELMGIQVPIYQQKREQYQVNIDNIIKYTNKTHPSMVVTMGLEDFTTTLETPPMGPTT